MKQEVDCILLQHCLENQLRAVQSISQQLCTVRVTSMWYVQTSVQNNFIAQNNVH